MAKKAPKKAARPAKSKSASRPTSRPVKKVVRQKPPAKPAKPARKPAKPVKPVKAAVAEKPAKVVPPPAPAPVPVIELPIDNPARKKGVRKATIATGIRETAPGNKLGRSRIPVDAPLDVVFQNDMQAREAFSFLGIHSIRELEKFSADELVLRLTGPAKLTVGRIRKVLAKNNRCLSGDEQFAMEMQDLINRPKPD